jgi:hypothetical protein
MGRIADWSEQAFLVRFRQSARLKGAVMPWGAYLRMRDDDVRASYRHLRTLPAVEHGSGAVIRQKS